MHCRLVGSVVCFGLLGSGLALAGDKEAMIASSMGADPGHLAICSARLSQGGCRTLTIQQHLEPEHVRDLLVPLPDDLKLIKPIADTVKKAIQVKEQLEELNDRAIGLFVSSLESIIKH